MNIIAPSPLRVDVRVAAIFLGLSKSYLDKLRGAGGGPAYLKLGSRVLYEIADLNSWAASHKRSKTAMSSTEFCR